MRKLRITRACVFSGGDRAAGEVLSFDVPPPDAAIVVGAGLAEWIKPEDEESREAFASCASAAERTAAVQASPPARPAKGQKKKAKK